MNDASKSHISLIEASEVISEIVFFLIMYRKNNINNGNWDFFNILDYIYIYTCIERMLLRFFLLFCVMHRKK